jgi:hypothetical protein
LMYQAKQLSDCVGTNWIDDDEWVITYFGICVVALCCIFINIIYCTYFVFILFRTYLAYRPGEVTFSAGSIDRVAAPKHTVRKISLYPTLRDSGTAAFVDLALVEVYITYNLYTVYH